MVGVVVLRGRARGAIHCLLWGADGILKAISKQSHANTSAMRQPML